MLYEKVMLDGEKDSYLEVYIADKIGEYVRDAILVIPGGGYSQICSEREGEPIGMAFMPYGYNAFVLHYSVGEGNVFPKQLIQASKAVKYIKDNAERFNINPDRVFAVGFSAGGHLAGSLGIMWDKKEIYDAVNMEFGYNKPTGVMLIYPVVNASSHKSSIQNLLGKEEPSEADIKLTALDVNVNENSAPAYIMHTVTDRLVSVRGSLLLAEAYHAAGVSFELHIYPDAPHGIALGNEITAGKTQKFNNPAIAKWIENAAIWAKTCK